MKTNYFLISFLILFISFSIPKTSKSQDSVRTLKVLCDYAYYPYEFIDANLKPDGFDIDIIKAIAKDLNYNVSIEAGNWSKIKKRLLNGEADLIAGMYYKVDRAERVNFSMPYIIITHSIFVKEGDYWNSLKDVRDDKNLKVIVENSSILHKYLNTAGINGSRIITVENQFDVLKTLSETKNTCAFLPKLQGNYTATKHGFDNIITVGLPILPREYSIAVNKQDTTLLNDINDAITNINNNGTYERIYNKWFKIQNPPLTEPNHNHMIINVIIVLLSVLLLLYIYKYFSAKKENIQKDIQLDRSEKELEISNKKLQESESLLWKITENTPYPIKIAKTTGEIIYMNSLFENEFGYHKKTIPNIDEWMKAFFKDDETKEEITRQIKQAIDSIKNNLDPKYTKTIILSTSGHHDLETTLSIIALGDTEVLFFYGNSQTV